MSSERTDALLTESFDPLKHIRSVVTGLHSGVKYASGKMIDQVLSCEAIAKETGDTSLQAVALLHKSQEKVRISKGQKPLEDDEIRELVTTALPEQAPEIIAALRDLKREPNDKDEIYTINKPLYWQHLNEWAVESPSLVKGMLLIEKFINFKASADVLSLIKADPSNASKVAKPDPEWHKEYVATRMPIVNSVGPAYPGLYTKIKGANAEVINLANTILGVTADIETVGEGGGAGGPLWKDRVSTPPVASPAESPRR